MIVQERKQIGLKFSDVEYLLLRRRHAPVIQHIVEVYDAGSQRKFNTQCLINQQTSPKSFGK